MFSYGGADGVRHVSSTLVVVGGLLLAVSTFVPTMRWSVNAKHDSAGSARVWFGDAWTLADGGFEGASLLPISAAAALLLAGAALLGRGRTAWRVQLALALCAGYLPVWTAVAFARKREDAVAPDLGVAMLAVAGGAILAGLWLGRPAGDEHRSRPADRESRSAAVDSNLS